MAHTGLMLLLEFGTKGRARCAWNIGLRKFTFAENSVLIEWQQESTDLLVL